MFKSFKPHKFATKSRNNYKATNILYTHHLDELCSECGYPYGMHYGEDCPTYGKFKELSADNFAKVIPYHAPEKLTQREKDIRAFRKFLYDNDALEAWYKNRKQYFKRRRSIFSGLSKERFIIGAFQWSSTEEGARFWNKLDIKWCNILEAH